MSRQLTSLGTSEEDVLSNIKCHILEEMRSYLCKYIEPGNFYPYLRSKYILSEDDEQMIENEVCRSKKASKLIDILLLRGDDAYEAFIKAIQRNKTQLFLVEKLQKEYEKRKNKFQALLKGKPLGDNSITIQNKNLPTPPGGRRSKDSSMSDSDNQMISSSLSDDSSKFVSVNTIMSSDSLKPQKKLQKPSAHKVSKSSNTVQLKKSVPKSTDSSKNVSSTKVHKTNKDVNNVKLMIPSQPKENECLSSGNIPSFVSSMHANSVEGRTLSVPTSCNMLNNIPGVRDPPNLPQWKRHKLFHRRATGSRDSGTSDTVDNATTSCSDGNRAVENCETLNTVTHVRSEKQTVDNISQNQNLTTGNHSNEGEVIYSNDTDETYQKQLSVASDHEQEVIYSRLADDKDKTYQKQLFLDSEQEVTYSREADDTNETYQKQLFFNSEQENVSINGSGTCKRDEKCFVEDKESFSTGEFVNENLEDAVTNKLNISSKQCCESSQSLEGRTVYGPLEEDTDKNYLGCEESEQETLVKLILCDSKA